VKDKDIRSASSARRPIFPTGELKEDLKRGTH
jgi:hypothetical protein